MPVFEDPAFAVFVWIVLAIAALAIIGGFAVLGAASGYIAGRRAPSSTDRSGAMAGWAIGPVVGVWSVSYCPSSPKSQRGSFWY